MTMESLPSIIFFQGEAGSGGSDMGDLEFLSIKEFEGKNVEDEASLPADTTGDLATLTASPGKDMYLAEAKVNVAQAASNCDCKIELMVNGTVVETYDTASPNSGMSSGTTVYPFAAKGLKVVAGEIIKLECTVNDSMRIESFLSCYEEDTGVSPQIPPLASV